MPQSVKPYYVDRLFVDTLLRGPLACFILLVSAKNNKLNFYFSH